MKPYHYYQLLPKIPNAKTFGIFSLIINTILCIITHKQSNANAFRPDANIGVKNMVYVYTATIHEENGTFYAAVPDIPGCISTGSSLSDAIKQITDALSVCLCVMEDEQDPIPTPSDHSAIYREATDLCTLVRVDTIAYRSLTDTRTV